MNKARIQTNEDAIKKAAKKLRRLQLTDVYGEKDIPADTVKSVIKEGLGGHYDDEVIVYILKFGVRYYLEEITLVYENCACSYTLQACQEHCNRTCCPKSIFSI